MRKIIVVLGSIITLIGIYQTSKYLFDYNQLTQYGKGYILGSVFLTIIGIVFLIVALKIKKRTNKTH